MNSNTADTGPVRKNQNIQLVLNLFLGAAGVAVWWWIYHQLPWLSKWLTYDVLPIDRGSHLGSSVEFFLYDTPKVMMLLFLVVFGVGIIRSFFTPEKTGPFCPGKANSSAMCWPHFSAL